MTILGALLTWISLILALCSCSTYTVSGSGTNMWFNSDELHFVWKKVSGDISLTGKPDSLKTIESPLETISIESFDRRVVYHSPSHLEAPNWPPEGQTLIFNSSGLFYKIPMEGGDPRQVIPFGSSCWHGWSPDSKQVTFVSYQLK